MAVNEVEWQRFHEICRLQHVNQEKFKRLSEALQRKYPLSGHEIAKIFLDPPKLCCYNSNPFTPYYVESLLDSDLVSLPSILEVLLQNSQTFESVVDASSADSKEKTKNCINLDDLVFDRLVNVISREKRPLDLGETLAVLSAATKWMHAVVKWGESTGFLHGTGEGPQLWDSTIAATQFLDSFNLFLCATAGSARFNQIISQQCPVDIRQSLEDSLTEFLPFLATLPLTNIIIQTTEKLDALQKIVISTKHIPEAAFGNDLLGGVDVDNMPLEEGALDVPLTTSRAGLFVFLNSLLVGVPMVEDNTVLDYLNTRYQGNHILMTTDLITASFDVASNAMNLGESSQRMSLLRSYLVNKLPLILTSIVDSTFNTLPAEACITEALSRLDPNAFPSFSQTFGRSNSNDMLADVRQDFLFACALHQLIREDSIERLLGEVPMSTLPTGGRYVKDDLVQKCSANSEHIDQLITELERMEGNSGAIANALTEIIQNLCADNETMVLKTICVSLAKRLQSLDVLLLFSSPYTILQPVCHLLDNWKFDEEQGESQPVYDEFGGILLFVLMLRYRYGLSATDLGLDSPTSFVRNLLQNGSTSQSLLSLSPEQTKHLSGWISGLFIAEGINDELMSSCKPTDFYLLVPTLLQQCLGACAVGKIDMDTLKGGFEYLLEPFLLPSLIGGLNWFSIHLINHTSDLDISLQVLSSIIKPRSISGEANAMHSAILSIVAKPLTHSLALLSRLTKHQNQTIQSLSDALKPYLHFSLLPYASISELQSWSSMSVSPMNKTSPPKRPSPIALLPTLAQTLRSMFIWSQALANSPPNHHPTSSPPTYPSRLLPTLLAILPPTQILFTIAAFLSSHPTPLALDLAVSLILSPTTHPPPLSATATPHPTTLETALTSLLASTSKISSSQKQTFILIHNCILELAQHAAAASSLAPAQAQVAQAEAEDLMQGIVTNAGAGLDVNSGLGVGQHLDVLSGSLSGVETGEFDLDGLF